MTFSRNKLLGILFCAALLIVHGVLAWTSAIRESATFDEPLHAVAAHVVRWHHDFRVNSEDPSLWEYWADLPHAKDSLHMRLSGKLFNTMLSDPTFHWRYVLQTLYVQSYLDADAWLNQSRFMMLGISLMLGAGLAAVAWRAGGPLCGVIASGLYCLDPNFIGHAPLVKNDVVFTAAMFAMCAAMWGLITRFSWWRAVLVGICCGVGLCVKFSGVLLPAMLIAVLLVRSLMPRDWGSLTTRLQRFLRSLVVIVIAGVISYTMIWATYGFRFNIAPDAPFNPEPLFQEAAVHRAWTMHPDHAPDDAEIKFLYEHPNLTLWSIRFGLTHRLLPQAWLDGFLYMYLSSLLRETYLLGANSRVGWWYYFPLTMLFKTPVATLAGFVLALVYFVRRKSREVLLILAFGLPAAIYFATVVTSNLNIGLRHVFPIYPAIFLMIACAAVSARRAVLIGILGLVLAGETLAAYPHYISFFNAPSRMVGPLKLLGDSNLDWGQDLKLLVEWQRQNPDVTLYLAYFGPTPPRYYGLKYIGLPGGYQWELPTKNYEPVPGVIAISASHLQGIYMNPKLRERYRSLLDRKPIAVLGGTIYLFTTPGIPPPQ